MVTETTNCDAALLPERHRQQDLFICDVADAVLRDIMQHMEHPFYSLSKKPETKVRRYEHNGNWIEITPSVNPLTPLNPAFADMPLFQLVEMVEQSCVFQSAELEAELNARLERTGQCWRFDTGGHIVLYYPGKHRPHQKPCNIGMFDRDALSQFDLADML